MMFGQVQETIVPRNLRVQGKAVFIPVFKVYAKTQEIDVKLPGFCFVKDPENRYRTRKYNLCRLLSASPTICVPPKSFKIVEGILLVLATPMPQDTAVV